MYHTYEKVPGVDVGVLWEVEVLLSDEDTLCNGKGLVHYSTIFTIHHIVPRSMDSIAPYLQAFAHQISQPNKTLGRPLYGIC